MREKNETERDRSRAACRDIVWGLSVPHALDCSFHACVLINKAVSAVFSFLRFTSIVFLSEPWLWRWMTVQRCKALAYLLFLHSRSSSVQVHVSAHVPTRISLPTTQDKMSSSEEDSKIDLLDPPKVVQKKIRKVFCEPGNIEKNPLLQWVQNVFFVIQGRTFV